MYLFLINFIYFKNFQSFFKINIPNKAKRQIRTVKIKNRNPFKIRQS